MLLGDNVDAFFQHIHRNVGLLFADHQWGRDANCIRTAAQQEDSTLERQIDNTVAFNSARRPRLLVGDDLNANHQAPTTNVANQVNALRPIRQSLQ